MPEVDNEIALNILSNGLDFFERYSLTTATVCVYKLNNYSINSFTKFN